MCPPRSPRTAPSPVQAGGGLQKALLTRQSQGLRFSELLQFSPSPTPLPDSSPGVAAQGRHSRPKCLTWKRNIDDVEKPGGTQPGQPRLCHPRMCHSGKRMELKAFEFPKALIRFHAGPLGSKANTPGSPRHAIALIFSSRKGVRTSPRQTLLQTSSPVRLALSSLTIP